MADSKRKKAKTAAASSAKKKAVAPAPSGKSKVKSKATRTAGKAASATARSGKSRSASKSASRAAPASRTAASKTSASKTPAQKTKASRSGKKTVVAAVIAKPSKGKTTAIKGKTTNATGAPASKDVQKLKIESKANPVAAKAEKPAVVIESAAPAPVVLAPVKPAPAAKPVEAKTEDAKKPPVATVAKPAPVAPVRAEPAKLVEARPAAVAARPAPARIEVKAAVKTGVHRTGFKSNEYIVYPAHGVGQIVAIEEQEVAGFKLELFVISFAKDKMTLKVPLPKVLNGAIRKLADADTVKRALDTLTGRARVKRTMWSRRAQEYEAKINSGDLGSIAEVVRDLYRSEAQPEQSYSERQLYEAALDRMAREIAAVNRVIETEALKLIEASLQKSPRRNARADGVVEISLTAVIGEAA